MKLYSYVVARDYGFAPNPFGGFLTLATCKPRIRKSARVGDWVVGTSSTIRNKEPRIVFVMRVDEIIEMQDYWNDPRFLCKRPNMYGSLKIAYGDNIYHRNTLTGEWIMENSHHSKKDGTPCVGNIKNDTGTTENVLIATQFAYWGGVGKEIPSQFWNNPGYDLVNQGQGHKSRFPEEFLTDFTDWFIGLNEQGYWGEPQKW